MKIQLSRDFAKRILDMDWKNIRAGISNGWLETAVAVDFGIKALESDKYSEEEVELAGLDYSDIYEIENKLESLAPDISGFDKDKWLKLHLAWVFENRSKLEDPLQTIEELYADFDYPECIAHLVRYMPSDGPPRNLIEDLKDYLNRNVYNALLKQTE